MCKDCTPYSQVAPWRQRFRRAMAIAYLFAFMGLIGSCAHVRSRTTIDVGVDVAQGVYPSAGASYPLAGGYVSAGVWGGTDYDTLGVWAWGPYLTYGYSWSLNGEK